MKDIRTRDTVNDIRTLDRAANVADRMKNAFVRTKEKSEQAQQTNADSPAGYAEDRAIENVEDLTRKAGYELRQQVKQLTENTRQKYNNRHVREDTSSEAQVKSKKAEHTATSSKAPASSSEPHTAEYKPTNYNARESVFAQDGARRRLKRSSLDTVANETKQGVKTVERGVKKSARASEMALKTSAKGSVKMAKRSVKTAERTSRAAIKTTKVTAKTAAKTAQATARATQRAAAQAARAVAKFAAAAIKTATKSVAAMVKVMIAAVKGIIPAIAAGGWVAVVVIVVVLLAASILGSVFGLFASDESYDGALSMPEVVSQINAEFSKEIDVIITANPHDTLVIDNAGSASMVANWDEVLAIYAVLVTSDPENPVEVATLNDAKVEKLKTVFWDINRIRYSVDEVVVGIDDVTEEPITETILTITMSYKTTDDMISYYGFSAERAAQVREMLQPEYAELFRRLTGSYVDITLTAAEIAAIMETLPDDLSEARKEVVLTAYSLLDKVKYFWGGKSLVLGWDSRWGTSMKVTADGSPSTGTVRPFGLDCSGFVDWVFYNAYNGEYIIGHGGGATAQYSYCDDIPWNDAQPGDLAFYPGCEHDGVVVKNDAGTLTIIHCASGYNNVVITQHTQGNGFAFAGRPQKYDE